jgi:hypothetical protein
VHASLHDSGAGPDAHRDTLFAHRRRRMIIDRIGASASITGHPSGLLLVSTARHRSHLRRCHPKRLSGASVYSHELGGDIIAASVPPSGYDQTARCVRWDHLLARLLDCSLAPAWTRNIALPRGRAPCSDGDTEVRTRAQYTAIHRHTASVVARTSVLFAGRHRHVSVRGGLAAFNTQPDTATSFIRRMAAWRRSSRCRARRADHRGTAQRIRPGRRSVGGCRALTGSQHGRANQVRGAHSA